MSNIPNLQPESDSSDSEASGENSLEVNLQIDSDVNCPLSASTCETCIRVAAAARGFTEGTVGLLICDDSKIQELNARHLQHDYPTDVISFTYENQVPAINGELVVSIDTARRRASELGWPDANELMLYIVHGVLHISGMQDKTPQDRAAMRATERNVMIKLGIDDIDQFHADKPRTASTKAPK